MPIRLEWDKNKAESNLKKHGVSFHEASTVFADINSITVDDEHHSTGEQRYLTVGYSERGRLLSVAHTDEPDVIGIISARFATRRERRQYEKGS